MKKTDKCIDGTPLARYTLSMPRANLPETRLIKDEAFLTALDVSARAERVLKELDTRPEIFDAVLNILCNGGSLITCAEKFGIPYSRLAVWVNAEPVRMERMRQAMAARDEYLIQRIIDELKSIGMHNVRDMFTEDGRLRPMSEIPPELSRCISSIDVEETYDGAGEHRTWTGYVKKIKMIDKLRAIELLSKAMVGFIEKKTITIENNYKVSAFDIEDRLRILAPVKAIDVTPAPAGKGEGT